MSQTYLRDGVRMIEVAPHQFVNERSAVALGLSARLPPAPTPRLKQPDEPAAPSETSDSAPIMPDAWRL